MGLLQRLRNAMLNDDTESELAVRERERLEAEIPAAEERKAKVDIECCSLGVQVVGAERAKSESASELRDKLQAKIKERDDPLDDLIKEIGKKTNANARFTKPLMFDFDDYCRTRAERVGQLYRERPVERFTRPEDMGADAIKDVKYEKTANNSEAIERHKELILAAAAEIRGNHAKYTLPDLRIRILEYVRQFDVSETTSLDEMTNKITTLGMRKAAKADRAPGVIDAGAISDLAQRITSLERQI